MLSKFRNLYPQGSILSELIDIDRGIYIVRVSIQIDGVTLATGLAGADGVEKAEDSARNRALQALVLEDGHLSLNLATKAPQKVTTSSQMTALDYTNHSHNSAPSKRSVSRGAARHAFSEIANHPATAVSQEEEVTATVKLAHSHHSRTSQRSETSVESLVKPQIPNAPVQDSLLSEPSVEAKNIPNPEPEAIPNLPIPETPISTPEYTEDIVEPSLNLTSDSADIPPISPHSNTSPSEGKRASLTHPEENYTTEEPSVTETPIEFDFNQIRHKIDLEMKRLSWTKEQGRDYLLSTYGKRSRLHLTDDELLEFWHYLETLPN